MTKTAGFVTMRKVSPVWQDNDIFSEGTYTFGKDGRMLDGYYYFINYGGKLITDQTYYVWEPNGLTMPMNCTFDIMDRIVL